MIDDLNLEIVKNQLNINQDFSGDDMLLYAYIDVAKEVVEKSLDVELDSLRNEDGMLPASIIHAMLLLIGSWYLCRESISASNMMPIPHAYDMLVDLWRNYDYKDAILKNTINA